MAKHDLVRQKQVAHVKSEKAILEVSTNVTSVYLHHNISRHVVSCCEKLWKQNQLETHWQILKETNEIIKVKS